MLASTYFAGSCSSCAALQNTPASKLPRSSGSVRSPSNEHIALHSTCSTSPLAKCYAMQMFLGATLTMNVHSPDRLLDGSAETGLLEKGGQTPDTHRIFACAIVALLNLALCTVAVGQDKATAQEVVAKVKEAASMGHPILGCCSKIPGRNQPGEISRCDNGH